jgi:ATP-dependent protease ClpP protease subunit
MREWFRVKAQADPTVAELCIYDVIGNGYGENAVSASRFVEVLDALPDAVRTIRVRVSSPGGDVADALVMYNALKAQRAKGRTVETFIEGMAASSATIVTCAGQPARIAGNALMMIHDPWTITAGSATVHRDAISALERFASAIVTTYRGISTKSEADIAAMMAATTWMNADEALANGFVTEIVEDVEIQAVFQSRSIKALGAIPLRYAAALTPWVKKPADPPPAAIAANPSEVLAACTAAGVLSLAESLVRAQLPLADVQARIDRAADIRAICHIARLPSLADGYIRAQMEVADVRHHVTTMLALRDNVEIDGTIDLDADYKPRAVAARIKLNPAEIYARRNVNPGRHPGADL